MMSDVAIRIEGLSKRYRIGEEQAWYKTLRGTLSNAATATLQAMRSRRSRDQRSNGNNIIWALKDVTFEVKQGEVVGVIGRNGAGKSTLLKILSRITDPTEGYAEIHGRVGSLLEVGTGFHPELTGRENVYLNGAILGMKKTEIARKFDEIVAFSEVEKFIDTPVKHYSSGMYLRLAFAVAAHLEPEILLVDEVLAVGDIAFQSKCLGKIQEVGKSGRTVLFVSHNMTAVSQLAPLSILLQNGTVTFAGSSTEAIRLYINQQQSREYDLDKRTDRQGDGVVRIESLKFYDAQGEAVHGVGSGGSLTIAIGYTSDKKTLHSEDLIADIRFNDTLGNPIASLSTLYSIQKPEGSLSKNGVLSCHIPNLTLGEETYFIDLRIAYRGGVSDYIERAGELQVVKGNFFGTGYEPVKRAHCAALIKHGWSVDENFPTTNDSLKSTTISAHASDIRL